METLADFIALHSQYAHFWIFGLLLLGGLNLPISEDVLLIAGGWLAYTLPLEHAIHLYLWIYLGCCLSAWEAYWIGRLLGHKIKKTSLLAKLEKVRQFYSRFGTWTFFVGRFIPFGVRNCLFISSGMSRMPFSQFISRDVPACLISSSTLFTLAYCFGKNHQILYQYVHTYERIIGLGLIACVILFFSLRSFRKPMAANPK